MIQKPDDNEITSLYKKGATEKPGKALDKTILDYASSKPAGQKHWWPYLGLAASIGLVTLIAPWRWADKTLPTIDDTAVMSEEEILPPPPAPIFEEESAPVRSMMKLSPKPKSAEKIRSLQAMPERMPENAHIAADTLAIPENPFTEVEQLLVQGKREEAKIRLEHMLSENPELLNELPDSLQTLLAEE